MIINRIRPRLIVVAVAAFLVAAGIVTTPTLATTQEPGFLGENPSGKFDRNGKPFISKRPVALDQKQRGFKKFQSSDIPSQAECPPTVTCIVMPAAYSPNNGNVEDYGNYDKANRPHDMKINSIVIHDTEGDLQSVLDAFQNPAFYASTHYVVNTDGTIYQMVAPKDIAWHAGNWSTNMHSIGIEHVGFAADSTTYTPEMYQASEKLVKYLSEKYDIPRDRGHIIGHDNVAATSEASLANMHVDPGPFWNWQDYMRGSGAPVLPRINLHRLGNTFVTIAPSWSRSQQAVTGCTDIANTHCVPDGLQATNFVYLRTEPRSDAPFFADPKLGQGTTDIKNNAARLFYGQKLAVSDVRLEREGLWLQVWVNGAKGWFYSPWNAPTALPGTGKYIVPKPGVESVAVYGRAIPERSEYPADLLAGPPASTYIPTPTALPYTVKAGQRYTVIDSNVPTDHFYAWASDSSFPYDHTVFKGQTKYIQIQLGNRVGYVKASDVVIK